MRTEHDLRQMQSLPLEAKILMTQRRIRDWCEHFEGEVYVSFSGGKDSTVLLDIARRIYPDIEAVFVDTGLEYPEIKQFVKTFDNVTILRPKMSFKDVIIKYGYPFISKEVSQTIYEVRQSHKKGNTETKREKKLLAIDEYAGQSRFNQSKYLPLVDAPFAISHYCCKVMKKAPFVDLEKRLKPISGIMAGESILRFQQWLKSGCNAFEANKQISNPMSFWTEQDVLQYIKIILEPPLKQAWKWVKYEHGGKRRQARKYLRKINYRQSSFASVYGELLESNKQGELMIDGCGDCLRFSGCQRTGCIFCGFGAHLDKRNGGESRFVRLRRTHPKLYDYCMGGGEFVDGIWQPNNKGLGMAYVIDELNRLYSKTLKSGKIKKFIEY